MEATGYVFWQRFVSPVPQLPFAGLLAPFDEQSLRYRRLPQGFTVYSVGPDFTDNGGKRPPSGIEVANGDDVVFTVGR